MSTVAPIEVTILNALLVKEAVASTIWSRPGATDADYAAYAAIRSAVVVVETLIETRRLTEQARLTSLQGELIQARQLPFPYSRPNLQAIARLEANVAHLEIALSPR